jgi:hypothetical protein
VGGKEAREGERKKNVSSSEYKKYTMATNEVMRIHNIIYSINYIMI